MGGDDRKDCGVGGRDEQVELILGEIMDRVALDELKMSSREDVVKFLKSLWNEEKTSCPMCGNELTLLHKKAKKSNCDWQCKQCHKVFKTIHLLEELNAQ